MHVAHLISRMDPMQSPVSPAAGTTPRCSAKRYETSGDIITHATPSHSPTSAGSRIQPNAGRWATSGDFFTWSQHPSVESPYGTPRTSGRRPRSAINEFRAGASSGTPPSAPAALFTATRRPLRGSPRSSDGAAGAVSGAQARKIILAYDNGERRVRRPLLQVEREHRVAARVS